MTLTEHLTESCFYEYSELFSGEIGSDKSLYLGCSLHLCPLIRENLRLMSIGIRSPTATEVSTHIDIDVIKFIISLLY